jgi:hypothetical protein
MNARRLVFALLAVACGLALGAAPASAGTAPTIAEEGATDVGPRSATLEAQITDYGAETTYHFEYGLTSSYGSSAPVEIIGGSEKAVSVSAPIINLTPNTQYHFRLVATSEEGTVDGGGASFTTLVPVFQGLPDNRGYEMVTPVENQNRELNVPKVNNGYTAQNQSGFPTKLPFQVALGGNAVTYIGEPTSPGGNGNTGAEFGDSYLGTRRPTGGWTKTNIQPPGYHIATYQGFSRELTTGFLTAENEEGEFTGHVLPPLAEGAPAGVKVLYARTLSEETYRPAFTLMPPHRLGEEFGAYGVPSDTFLGREPAYAGASADGSRVLFEANDALTQNAEAGEGNANNLYESVDGELNLVNVLPGNEKSEVNATFGGPRITGGSGPDFSHVISEDGMRIFWTDLNTGIIYAREDGTSTVPVSLGSAQYWTATPDGRLAFYTEGERLWRFDIEDEARVPLTGAGAEVQGVIGVSEDGEYIYFVANGSLVEGATPGEPNVYLLHGGTTRLVATLAGGEGEHIAPFGIEGGQPTGDWIPSLGHRTAEVTPNGQALVFMSSRSLTGYENGSLEEVYVYEASGSGRLSCVSCSQSGERPPVYNEEIGAGESAAFLPISWSNTYTPQWISDDGSRVFFDSDEPLVPQDTDDEQDVYEWERDDSGSCHETAGCIYLLSGGANLTKSWLIGADATGENVFFISRAKFVPEDGNESLNLFDARVGSIPPPLPPQCTGTGCQGLPSASPVFATPPSVTFEGVGNFPTPSASAVGSMAAKSKASTRKLTSALKICAKERQKRKRVSCEARARRQYGKSDAGKASKRRSY